MTLSFKDFDILSLVVFISCIDIPYINREYGKIALYTFIVRTVLLLLFFTLSILHKHTFSKTFKLITVFFAMIIISTAPRDYDSYYAIKMLSMPYVIVLYTDLFYSKTNRILTVWNFGLLLLSLMDIASMLMFPDGLYQTELYTNNWFLGYKTQHFVYLLPWCFISAYLSLQKFGKIKNHIYVVICVSTLILIKAGSTAATVSILILGISYMLVSLSEHSQNFRKILYQILNYKIFIPVILVVAWMVVMIQQYKVIVYLVTNILNKDATLSTRTFIWEKLIPQIKEAPYFGYGYLNSSQYIDLSNNIYATNAHNMYLAILISAGLVGLVVYLGIMITSLKYGHKMEDSSDAVIILAIVAFLIIGMTSATFVFSTFSFLPFLVLVHNKHEKVYKENKPSS